MPPRSRYPRNRPESVNPPPPVALSGLNMSPIKATVRGAAARRIHPPARTKVLHCAVVPRHAFDLVRFQERMDAYTHWPCVYWLRCVGQRMQHDRGRRPRCLVGWQYSRQDREQCQINAALPPHSNAPAAPSAGRYSLRCSGFRFGSTRRTSLGKPDADQPEFVKQA